ncbi:MAG: hypothetical protein KF760_12865 [Candidatus Eremiobacteraeota bacterium]|nr:hypothetical protein [Candidatus Eremiobacteraeota bacterium]MCW5871777.1 hypothetical protein [Candidatus Eremiobacteraeota bacterium]
MQPVSKGVSTLDLQKLRQQNDDSLQTRATQQLGAELKAGSQSGVSKEEKLTAGQDDQVDLTAKEKSARSTSRTPAPEVPVPASSANPTETASESSAQSTAAETAQEENSGGGSQQPDPQKPLYNEEQLAFANRLRELEDQRKTLADMWRKLYMDYMADQMQAVEDMENFRQTTGLLWTDVCTSRWIQGARHSEAMRSLL